MQPRLDNSRRRNVSNVAAFAVSGLQAKIASAVQSKNQAHEHARRALSARCSLAAVAIAATPAINRTVLPSLKRRVTYSG